MLRLPKASRNRPKWLFSRWPLLKMAKIPKTGIAISQFLIASEIQSLPLYICFEGGKFDKNSCINKNNGMTGIISYKSVTLGVYTLVKNYKEFYKCINVQFISFKRCMLHWEVFCNYWRKYPKFMIHRHAWMTKLMRFEKFVVKCCDTDTDVAISSCYIRYDNSAWVII